MGWDFTADSELQAKLAEDLEKASEKFGNKISEVYGKIDGLSSYWVGEDYNLFKEGTDGYKTSIQDFKNSIMVFSDYFKNLSESTNDLAGKLIKAIGDFTSVCANLEIKSLDDIDSAMENPSDLPSESEKVSPESSSTITLEEVTNGLKNLGLNYDSEYNNCIASGERTVLHTDTEELKETQDNAEDAEDMLDMEIAMLSNWSKAIETFQLDSNIISAIKGTLDKEIEKRNQILGPEVTEESENEEPRNLKRDESELDELTADGKKNKWIQIGLRRCNRGGSEVKDGIFGDLQSNFPYYGNEDINNAIDAFNVEINNLKNIDSIYKFLTDDLGLSIEYYNKFFS